ncbi:MAG: hypothetical protein CMC19_10885 [Flavobacteriaceae bacterium]|nr:hypothetical protein [Flavobacteriaceae bacterium]
MNLYTLKGLPELLLNTSLFRGKRRRNDKLILLDKCNWFIHRILTNTYGKNEDNVGYKYWVNIHSEELKKFLGTKSYIRIKNTLVEELQLIEENEVYSAKNFSKSYRLTEKAQSISKDIVPLYSQQFQNTYQNEIVKNCKVTLENKVLFKLYHNLSQLITIDEWLYWVEHITEDEYKTVDGIKMPYPYISKYRNERYALYYNEFKRLNKLNRPIEIFSSVINFKPTKSNAGRIYYLGTSIPRHIRAVMRTKSNELLYEVDMSSAQPSILFLSWLESNTELQNVDKEIKEEYAKMYDLVVSGSIYKYIQQNSEYCKGLEYNKLKKSILTTINAKYKPTPLNKELKKLFPSFMDWLNSKKEKEGHKSVSHLGQSLEASIFVETYRQIPEDTFSLLIHDCVLTTKENTSFIKKLLINRTKELFSCIKKTEDLNRLFKIELVSIKDEDTFNYQLDKYYENFKSEN